MTLDTGSFINWFRARPATGKWIAVFSIGLIVSAAVWAWDASGGLTQWENRAYDSLFVLKAWLRPAQSPPRQDVVVIEIDDKTLAREPFLGPRILWGPYFGIVLKGLAEAGAGVIGLDILLADIKSGPLAKEYRQTWLKNLAYCKGAGSPVILGGYYLGNRLIMPGKQFLMIGGLQQFGLVNLTVDSDDFCRRQRLYFPPVDDSEEGLFSFSYVLARTFRPDIERPGDVIHIDFLPQAEPFRKYSFADVYQDVQNGATQVLRECFKNKIVLIGETHSLIQDRHPTPLYHLGRGMLRRTSGVEIHAYTASTLLEGRFFRPVPSWVRWIVYFILAIGVSGYAVYGRLSWLPAVFAGILLVWIGLSLAAFSLYLIPFLAGGAAALVLSLASAFSYRYWVVDRRRKIVEAESAEMKHKLELARQVQLSLAPRKTPRLDSMDIAGTCIYCDETGGDYYDYIEVDGESGKPDRLAVVVGDVSDHGIPSALLMTAARASLRQRRAMPGEPGRIITDLNRQLAHDVDESGRFMTMFYAEIDLGANSCRWVTAGHDPALFYDPDNGEFSELGGRGIALGLFEDFEYPENVRNLAPGNILTVSTDGVWEAVGREGAAYGKDRLKSVIRRESDRPAQDMVKAVLKDMEAFGVKIADQDDVTLVVVKVLR